MISGLWLASISYIKVGFFFQDFMVSRSKFFWFHCVGARYLSTKNILDYQITYRWILKNPMTNIFWLFFFGIHQNSCSYCLIVAPKLHNMYRISWCNGEESEWRSDVEIFIRIPSPPYGIHYSNLSFRIRTRSEQCLRYSLILGVWMSMN